MADVIRPAAGAKNKWPREMVMRGNMKSPRFRKAMRPSESGDFLHQEHPKCPHSAEIRFPYDDFHRMLRNFGEKHCPYDVFHRKSTSNALIPPKSGAFTMIFIASCVILGRNIALTMFFTARARQMPSFRRNPVPLR
ncbi:hypothetical protein [Cohnella endophytica]|uniref:hypothetical protein n=1 Tax=Cohnella endophytica TaxID=2419778 RepID=UPI0011C42586|nr:hypothetical protein [Cohnella endophytica]